MVTISGACRAEYLRLKASALILAFAVTLAASCAEAVALVPQDLGVVRADSAALLDGLTSTLRRSLFLHCEAMPTASDTEWIGPAGGTLNVGPHRLVIPAGALDARIRITAVAPSGPINRIEFYPHGLEFDRPARLSMSYANCGLVGSLLPRHIAYTDERLRVLDLFDAVPNVLRRETTAPLDHFSDYILVW